MSACFPASIRAAWYRSGRSLYLQTPSQYRRYHETRRGSLAFSAAVPIHGLQHPRVFPEGIHENDWRGLMEKQASRSPWRVLRERKWIIMLVVVVAVLAAGALTFMRTPQYRATATMVREQTSLDQTLLNTTIFQYEDIQRDLVTIAQSLTSARVATLVKTQIQSPKSTGQLLQMVKARAATDSNNVTVTVVSADPKEAADMANAFVAQTIILRQQTNKQAIVDARTVLESQLAAMTQEQLKSANGQELQSTVDQLKVLEQVQTGGYVLWQPAGVPGVAFSPRPTRDMGVGLALGLILGLIFAFVLDRVDRRIKRESDFEHEFKLPVLASIPRQGKWTGRDHANRNGFVGFRDPRSPLLEAYRSLRSGLQYFEVDKGLRTILVVSGLPREGKTATSANLALSLALSGDRVIVVDADLRNPMLHNYLGLENDIGLSTVLAGGSEISEAVRVVKLDRFLPPNGKVTSGGNGRRPAESVLQRDLLCVTSGPLPPNPAELLASAKMEEVLSSLSGLADHVVLDTPPVLLVADALSIASRVDGVVIVARTNSTTSDEAREVRTILNRVGARLIGVVVGGVKAGKSNRYKYGYYGFGDDSAA
jgi:Mrp family chromosome partitioning ATPase/capsular polysaccharide biosynthesis protein